MTPAHASMPLVDLERLMCREIVERFWSRVDGSDDPFSCWPFRGAMTKHGYGRVRVRQHNWRAHRFAWTISRGPIAPGLHVCHRCDNPSCCNPAHLFLGTQRENAGDMAAKGRAQRLRGSAKSNSVLTEECVRELRAMVAGGRSISSLARGLGVDRGNLSRAVRGLRWGHVR